MASKNVEILQQKNYRRASERKRDNRWIERERERERWIEREGEIETRDRRYNIEKFAEHCRFLQIWT